MVNEGRRARWSPLARRGPRALRRASMAVTLATMVLVGAPALAGSAPYFDPSGFGLESFTTASSSMEAGGHPDVSTSFRLRTRIFDSGTQRRPYGFGALRRVEVDMPNGLAGNPTRFPTCPLHRFLLFDAAMGCPRETQVGIAMTELTEATPVRGPVFNLERGPDEPVLLGLKVDPTLYAFIRVRVRPDGGLTATVDQIPFSHPVLGADLTLWGVPADHNGSGAPRVPFMSGPTECETIPTTRIRVYSYQGTSDSASHSLDHPPENCDRVPFDPTMTAVPTERRAGVPTGLDVAITVPQNDLPDGRVSAHVHEVQVTLPEGMKVSPSSANGLEACTSAQFGYRTDSQVMCPDGSKIGTVTVRTPLLEQPMTGSVYLAKQGDNPFGSLLALYIHLQGTGQQIKLIRSGRCWRSTSTCRAPGSRSSSLVGSTRIRSRAA